ncbi:MAG: Fis family transcriptional regulator [Pseudonocardia sp.]|nr:Fis family transcriptional regulator [Pseudonocardia sp.]
MTAHFDASGPAVVVAHLDVRDPAVVAEARRWSTGHRAAAVSADEMAGADLTAFVTQAVVIGSHAIATAGGAQEAYNLEALVTEVGERTAEASRQATRATDEAIRKAAATIEASTTAVRTAIGELGTETRRAFSENVDTAGKTLTGEVNRLLGGEHPELLARLTPVIERFGRELETRSSQQTGELIAKAARQFDPADPASPAAQQARLLVEQQQRLAATLTKDNADLARKLDELAETVKLAQAASNARAAAVRASTLKGKPFEDAMHDVLAELAAGFGDEYIVTSTTAGRYPHNKKGDGVLALHGSDVRVVVEMSDSNRGAGWGAYLDETERNRDARASLGIVRSATQLGEHAVLSLGPRRLLMAFDPETDSVDLLRTVLQLLRLAALTTAHDERTGEVRIAEEKITAAMGVLDRIDKVTKSVGLIRQHAATIGDESEALRTELSRLLTQARTALGAATDGTAGGEGAGIVAA